ncbi:alpha-L-arabinofuranosidase II precursor [Gracilibacillus boraciitolerans JCM 21714]|uniref:Alpha-L-arabinofuranosidase II n=1 Tax=Gracilibacillus boraciitolerans JCM 21714 TaxID=1298598 RepID=W4VFC7_9BACI|nr:family 43 glycosylhydrolase [Gracilibacillus boraciitolerans]GAE92110.1 alpha-L-arabinofuranosidase II precursor [Gracilibacillus boraciitolerans JCM 21714]
MEVKRIHNVEMTVTNEKSINLPKHVDVDLNDNITAKFNVNWEEVNQEKLEKNGSIEIEGEVVHKDYSKPFIEQRADPFLYKHSDGYYYFTGSYPLYDRVVLRRAKTIDELPQAEERVIWWKHESGIMSEHIWAPEIHYIDGKWYIYVAAGDIDDVWAIRPYVLECDAENPLEGEWKEKGQINTEFQSFSLDATTFEHHGKRYLVWAQKVEEDTISNLYIAEMKNPWTIKKQVFLSTPELDWEVIGFDVNEGPAMIKNDKKIFIAFSASATDENYAVGLLHADIDSNLLDPESWIKEKEPVLVSSENTNEYGPGHNSFSVDEEGYELLVYHARPYKGFNTENPLYDHNRHARIQRLFWTSDGFPYFGEPGYQLDFTNHKAKAKITLKQH